MAGCDLLLQDATLVDRHGMQHTEQAIAIANGRILWTGSLSQLPPHYLKQAIKTEHCQGKLITPGLIDCHTHLVYAGHRADEFKKRLEGATYAEIARSGGGILSTVKKTRAVSEDVLLQQSLPRIQALGAEGVTTVEIKSGYGLDLESELKMLRVAKQLEKITGMRVLTTFLGAHAIPPEYHGRSQDYVDYLCQEVLPAVVEAGLADAVDVFCESIAFSLAQTEQLFRRAQELELRVKCHAEQLSSMGATALAARYGALSSDHLEHLEEAGIAAMAKANMVAVLLPGAYYFLRETRKPPIESLRQAGVGMAIATDCNPGSSPTTSLLLMMNMACQFFSLTIPEVWSAVTYQAARALGVAEERGALEAGKQADLVRWSVKESEQLCYQFGYPCPHERMIAGKWQHPS
ncbi:imidazolonepropionase [Legionella oakridgensis]|uniref:Imidazolonepropionase n=2 Tax=Legionella oakridgensis TaxID=29423 RepID=W0BCY8_9GAMM|nr:imidazolonepropionase [Legionella oakridgensis]AHE66566.1 imidazolonepropionase [Legionella oakridgensis ATCC 33761 = DSM 21215]ETO93660.1 imidazolonepropionase [Legionella oakridgensis RV-2-2007]KTD37829.1 imidazolonepropionase [Legionella oakridgensis]STY19718.1 imidazolonepropionase [Legionella longbeachae]